MTSMRNEAPFIVEWLAYHRVIGFTDFVIFSNDCEDGTDAILGRLAQMGEISHFDNPPKGRKAVQWQALSRAWPLPQIRAADWIMASDVDEFLVIHAGGGRLDDLFAAHPAADGFMISWRMFGNAGIERFDPDPVTRQFTRAAPARLNWPWRAIQFKTVFRNSPQVRKLGVHQPRMGAQATPHWVDDAGRSHARIAGTVRLSEEPRYGLAQINHYALGSIENFLVKVDRGRSNVQGGWDGLAYWADRNFNDVEDLAIQRHSAAVSAEMARLMADAQLRALVEAGIAWRRARIAELLGQLEPFHLWARVRQLGDSRVLPMAQQRDLLRALVRLLQAERARVAESSRTPRTGPGGPMPDNRQGGAGAP